MTEIAESVMVGIILEHTDDCPLCEDTEEPKRKKTIIDPDPNDDAKQIGNDSGKLDKNMAAEGYPRPVDWLIGIPTKNHKVTPNPHHLIPGNESLKKSTKLLKWMFENKGKITGDIGYDVNNYKNGVWLPSNNSMRGDARWKDNTIRKNYVVAAMDKSEGHFHDRHGKPYSQFVTKILNKIADRMDGIEILDMECPYVTKKKDDKFLPPYWLYQRLNGVSLRLAGFLSSFAKRQDFIFTSKLVKQYWDRKNTPYFKKGSPM